MSEIHLHRIDLNLLVTFEALMEESTLTAAADRLAVTPSAVSHALGRLRTQLNDPLLVRVGGRMQPSPYALELIEEVRPVLRGLRRMLAPRHPFDPATSDRVFRVMMPSFPAVVTAFLARIGTEAPGVTLEWVNVSAGVYDAVADGLIDIAHVGGDLRMPEGLEHQDMEPFTWVSFARADHPAATDWGRAAWVRWLHLQVKIDTNTLSPVDARQDDPTTTRRIGAKIGEFSAVGAVLSETDFLTTLPTVLMASQMKLHNLCALRPAVSPDRFRVRFVWSSRLHRDPGNLWLRTALMEVYDMVQAEATAQVAAQIVELSEPTGDGK
ncbi:LysR family transcriptional regulator [Cognatishimia sp. F0-27]|uniref:LysR family transcriptional regulator n=1 Tax=Cognatishimia sp. F0-27 TaxID=2816855 RepID=UPI001D0CCBB4|nr:LysR family transcriptional regulator [Cognatishimia sp. F0-27]MCC1492624.1 LysR family transcriptional regulator [Cognatishimia sp. F0-27]